MYVYIDTYIYIYMYIYIYIYTYIHTHVGIDSRAGSREDGPVGLEKEGWDSMCVYIHMYV